MRSAGFALGLGGKAGLADEVDLVELANDARPYLEDAAEFVEDVGETAEDVAETVVDFFF